MSLFFLLFFTLYTGMHCLVFWGLHPLLKGHPALPTLTWIWMGSMILAPLLVRVSERQGLETLARGMAWIGYSWMGFVFVAFSMVTLLACWELLWLLVRRLIPNLPSLSIHGPITALVILLTVIAASFYGFYEANNLRIETVKIVTPKLPSGAAPIRIAQISDLHLGLIHRDEALAPIISRLQALKPDILVATGDIVDAQINHLDDLVALWQRFSPPLGKFAVTGNHEYYAGLDQALDFLQQSRFRVLRNEHVEVGDHLTLAGVDDPARSRQPDEAAALGDASSRFTLLLKHRPEVTEAAQDRIDLQLSGHTHRGQIFPFNLLTGLEYPQQDGLYQLPRGNWLYTSRGTGTWGPPMRILSAPEITLFEITPM